MTDLPAITLDASTLTGLAVISAAISVAVSGAKAAALRVAPDLDLTPWWRLSLRALAVLLGVAAVLAWLGPGVVEAALGVMAGAASEVVYRYVMRRIEVALMGET